jgi:CRP-like cAMP-binding protein
MNPSSHRTCDPAGNQLLAALPVAEKARWLAYLEPIELRRGQLLCESGKEPSHAVFPTSAIVSMQYWANDGASTECAVIGNDGVVGLSLFLGGNAALSRMVVQTDGEALCLSARAVKQQASASGPLLSVVLRYALDLIGQVAQTAACNRFHSIDQRLSRRLLLALDQSPSADLAMTQETVAGLLGVRREGVTTAALKLQRAGVIRYRRGHVEVLDREHLESLACECYSAGHRTHQQALPAAVAM